MAEFAVETECLSADTVCEYKNCKQQAAYEMFSDKADFENGIAKHRCKQHKQR
jgi:hypothetical protein